MGILDDIADKHGIDPSQYTCEVCEESPASGTVGDFRKLMSGEPDPGKWVCKSCYRKIFPNSSIPD
jgi:hypothetical protein